MTTLIPKYDQGSTGAVNRAINLKLAESVSVLDFGADPTGVADATLAFQNAVNASNHVYVPSGTYKINASRITPITGAKCGVQLPSNCTVTLDSDANLVVTASSETNAAIFGSYDTQLVTVNGGFFYGDRTGHTGGSQYCHGIDFRGVDRGRIIGSFIRNCQGDGIYLGAGATGTFCDNIVIDKVDSNNNYRNGMSIVAANNVVVTNSTFRNTNGVTPQAGIDIETNSGTLYNTNIKIIGCTFSNNTGDGVDILRGQSVVIADSYFYGNRGGHSILGSVGQAASKNIKIVNNTYENCAYNMIELGDNLNDILIEGNLCYAVINTANGIIHCGVTPTTTNYMKIVNNTFYSTTNSGFSVFSYSVTDALTDYDFRGNTVYMGNAMQTLDWKGLNLLCESNKFIITSALGNTNAISFTQAGRVRVNNNLFSNATTTNQAIISSINDIIVGPDNSFSQYFYNGNINTAAPTGGYWTVGDKVYFRAPTSGGYIGSVCTTAGTPGTWKSFGAIL
jgi:hypothetical protein